MTPEQFDLFIKNTHLELTTAWEAVPPKDIEVIAKAIMDYQYKATTAILNSIQGLNQLNQQMDKLNHKRIGQVMARLDDLEDEIKKLKK